jgi:prophage DNA circulation protein
MAWRDKLQRASFRGVAFEYENVEQGGGRRLAEFEYPLQDTPATEDMGRKRREFSLEAYIVGEDYLERAQQLLDALEQSGPGELIHPTRGTLRVSVKTYRMRETNRDGGMAVFSLSFTETGTELYPSAVADLTAELGAASEAAVEASRSEFLSDFSVTGLPQFVTDSAAGKLGGVSDSIGGNLKFLKTNANDIAKLGFDVRNLRRDALQLVANPAELAGNLISSVRGLGAISLDSSGAFTAYRNLFGTKEQDRVNIASNATSTRRQEKKNNEAIPALKRRVALASGVEQAVSVPFESYQDAISARDELLDAIDSEIEDIQSDEAFNAFQALRAKVVQLVPPEDQDLPQIKKIQRADTEPSLVVAFDLYESLDNEQDIVDRNKVRNPAFVPGGTDLEVLSE